MFKACSMKSMLSCVCFDQAQGEAGRLTPKVDRHKESPSLRNGCSCKVAGRDKSPGVGCSHADCEKPASFPHRRRNRHTLYGGV